MIKSVIKSNMKWEGWQEESLRLSYRKELFDKTNFFVLKRAGDIMLSSLVILLILSWLYPVLAVLIKLSSRGPVLFSQKRVGYMGRTFNCLKFRTMRLNAQADQLAAQENDVRITRVGNFLRKSNLDELPQFINVFLGQMSIVGPRPHMHADCVKFSQVIAHYKYRNFVKPGITGLAQVKGFRGPADTFEQIFHRYQYDAFYVRNAGFWLDIRIIRKTAAQTFFYMLGKLIGKENFHEIARDKKVYRRATFAVRQMIN